MSGTTRDRSDDDRLLDAMLAPPPVEDAQASLEFWRRREQQLPLYRRRARRHARTMAAQAEQQLRAARRARYGPSLLEQLSETLGISISGRQIRRLLLATVLSLVLVVVLIAIAAAAFWPELGPIILWLIGNGGGE